MSWPRIRKTVAGAVVLTVGLTMPPSVAVVAQQSQPTFRAVSYVPPIVAGVLDPFRPPAHIGAPGNRGLEFDNAGDDLVIAAADGFVTFAGSVAGRKAVTIHHPDNVRTSYTSMAVIWVGENAHVEQGDAIGRAEANLHFGARIGAHYLDPQVLLDASESPVRARLVPPPSGSGPL